jgi:putative membrane protein
MNKIFQFALFLTIAALSTLAGDAFAQWRGYQWGHGPGMMGGGYGMGWFGMIIMAAFWIAVIVGIVFLIRWLVLSTRTEGHKAHPEDSALEILKKRYARGEIDKEEFEEKKKDLT